MADLVDQKVILAVAQRPFESQSEGGIFNQFGTLAPVVLANGRRVDEKDFPNNGLVWWMLRSGTSQFALPGALVEGTLELALQYEVNNPDKMVYQVKRESVDPVKMDSVVEI